MTLGLAKDFYAILNDLFRLLPRTRETLLNPRGPH